MTGPIRAAHFPSGYDHDPRSYIGLLKRALERGGVKVSAAPALTRRWAASTTDVDVVHLHWLEFIVQSDDRPVMGIPRTLARAARFAAALRALRRRGIPIVWTVHNLRPHEQAHRFLDRALAAGTFRVADRVIVHSDYARARVESRHRGAPKTAVIPHGNYVGAYPPENRSRAQLRRERGIPEDAFVFLAFGQVRPYKRLTEVASALATLPDGNLRVLVAGEPTVEAEARDLRAASSADPRLILDLRRIPDCEVMALHRLADAAVIAYRDVFSSGALLLAVSCGLPVVALAHGSAVELVEGPAIEPFTPGRLSDALERMGTGDQQARSEAALRTAESHPWSGVAAATIGLYSDALARVRGPR
ncbi:MAG: glycosyltransferase [Solirubrobacteraceae bacterium]